MSPNNEFKAAFSYDEYKQWYAFTIYEVKDKKDKLILISKIDDSFIENVIFKFTVDSNYLFYATQRHGYYEVYIFNERRTYECLGVFDLKNTKKKLMKNCVLE
ncbi:MAG: hypothetical protein JKY28_00055 [Sulfurimonas sp.]|nr:hypothetical protein [Sulfurimonas sp.]